MDNDHKIQVSLHIEQITQWQDIFKNAQIPLESVIQIEGILKKRPEKDQKVFIYVSSWDSC